MPTPPRPSSRANDVAASGTFCEVTSVARANSARTPPQKLRADQGAGEPDFRIGNPGTALSLLTSPVPRRRTARGPRDIHGQLATGNPYRIASARTYVLFQASSFC